MMMTKRDATVVTGTLLFLMACMDSGADPTSTPVGYEVLRAHGAAYSLFSLRLHQPAEVIDTFESVAGTVLSDQDNDFDALLTDGEPYVVELTGGVWDGRVLDVVSFEGHAITVDTPVPTGSGIEYRIRKVPRLSQIISPLEIAAVDDFNPDHGDLVLVPVGDGKFNEYYCSSRIGHAGYFNAVTGVPEDPLLDYTDSFLYLRRGSVPLDLVFVGEVKVRNTILSVTDRFSYVGSVYPVITLADTHLEASIQVGPVETADILWLQDLDGNYKRYHHTGGGGAGDSGWRSADGEPGSEWQDQGTVPIQSGMIIQRRGESAYEALLEVPDYYLSL